MVVLQLFNTNGSMIGDILLLLVLAGTELVFRFLQQRLDILLGGDAVRRVAVGWRRAQIPYLDFWSKFDDFWFKFNDFKSKFNDFSS